MASKEMKNEVKDARIALSHTLRRTRGKQEAVHLYSFRVYSWMHRRNNMEMKSYLSKNGNGWVICDKKQSKVLQRIDRVYFFLFTDIVSTIHVTISILWMQFHLILFIVRAHAQHALREKFQTSFFSSSLAIHVEIWSKVIAILQCILLINKI